MTAKGRREREGAKIKSRKRKTNQKEENKSETRCIFVLDGQCKPQIVRN
jgi:hypothetical protein